MERISIQRTANDNESGAAHTTLWLTELSEQAIRAFERREAEIILAETPDPRIHYRIGDLALMPT